MIFNPAHPGEVLRDYLGEMTVGEAASRLGITRAHLSRILNGHAGHHCIHVATPLGCLGNFRRFLAQDAVAAGPLARSKGVLAKGPSVPAYCRQAGLGNAVEGAVKSDARFWLIKSSFYNLPSVCFYSAHTSHRGLSGFAFRSTICETEFHRN
jgi:hypothetical protein